MGKLSAVSVIVLGMAGIGAAVLVIVFGGLLDQDESRSAAVNVGQTADSPVAVSGPEQDTAAEPAQEAVSAAAPEPTTSDSSEALAVSASQDALLAPTDPDYLESLTNSRLDFYGWPFTDFRRHSVPYEKITFGGVPRDGIPPLDNPKFVSTADADEYLAALEPVIAFEVNGEAKAYPLRVITWHEIVNDELGGVPVAATFCPLCNSAIVFDRTLDGTVYDFGVSGNLLNSDLIMWDRQTESWWQQFTGEGIVGIMTGRKLTVLASSIISWSDFKTAHPNALVLSDDTGHLRNYGTNPYSGYDRVDSQPFLYDGVTDGRLLPKERVVAITVGGVDAAFPFSVLEQERVVGYNIGGSEVVVFYKSGTTSALDQSSISRSRDVGATGVFVPEADGQRLTFRADGESFVDEETGSVWNILGRAIDGPLSGEQLEPIVHANHFWFAWGAFKPDTKIYGLDRVRFG